MKPVMILFFVLIISSCATIREIPEPFVVDLNSPQIPLGEIDLQLDRFLGGLRRETVNLIYFPREDAVALQFRHEMMTYHQFWSREGRALFIRALEQYNEDFTARTLENQNARRSRQIYGTAEGFLTWRGHRFGVQARANMTLGLGYVFRDRSPYFTIHQGRAEFIDPATSSNRMESSPITLHFTRAQAAELASFFRQDILNELSIQNREIPAPPAITDIERDDFWAEPSEPSVTDTERDEY